VNYPVQTAWPSHKSTFTLKEGKQEHKLTWYVHILRREGAEFVIAFSYAERLIVPGLA